MIERNLRDVTLRKYGSVFIDTFGFYPLTFFGTVGDNFTDNYANIQVAINESIKKGLKYIFVPNGTYQYTGNLLDVDKITFIGNSQFAKIVNGDTEIPIYQIGMQSPFEGGTVTVNGKTVKIETKTKNPTEVVLVLGSHFYGLHIMGDMVYYNNAYDKINTVQYALSGGKTLKKINILADGIYLEFNQELTDFEVEWRVR